MTDVNSLTTADFRLSRRYVNIFTNNSETFVEYRYHRDADARQQQPCIASASLYKSAID